MKKRTRAKIKREVYSWVVVIAVVIVLRAVFVEAFVIPTGSMEQTLLVGDALLVNRFIYGMKIPVPLTNTQIPLVPGRIPRRGDLVVFVSPFELKDVVKRCCGIPGDTITIVNKVLYVNGKRAEEPYVRHIDARCFPHIAYDSVLYQQRWESAELFEIFEHHVRDNFGPVVVPEDHIFVMGDNRDNSFDSRFWGPLHTKYLKGKPLVIYFSFDPGHEASTIFDLIRIWEWKAIRLSRIGRVV